MSLQNLFDAFGLLWLPWPCWKSFPSLRGHPSITIEKAHKTGQLLTLGVVAVCAMEKSKCLQQIQNLEFAKIVGPSSTTGHMHAPALSCILFLGPPLLLLSVSEYDVLTQCYHI